MQSAPERYTHLHQGFSDAQREKLRLNEDKIKTLEDDLKTKTELWEDVQRKNVELTKQLAEQTAKAANLQKIMVRAGRNDNVPVDRYIIDQFLQLKNDILRMAKDHLTHTHRSPEVAELRMRSHVASALYEKFFSRDAMLFGYEDELLNRSPMRVFEEKLRKSHCDESVIKEWRVTTIKACKLLRCDSDKYVREASNQIWKEYLSRYCRHLFHTSERKRAHDDLDALCKIAVDLAISFRGSSIEYEWEQSVSPLGLGGTSEHEIIGVDGHNHDGETNYEISFIVFGGVVRGDKNTGLLEHGRTRLSKAQVVIRYRASESPSRGIMP